MQWFYFALMVILIAACRGIVPLFNDAVALDCVFSIFYKSTAFVLNCCSIFSPFRGMCFNPPVVVCNPHENTYNLGRIHWDKEY